MLQQLLLMLQDGGSHTVGDLAQELETSPSLVEAMMEDLSRRGYLQEMTGSCSQECSCCPLGPGCTVGGATKIWNLTKKGKEFIA